jgi:PleD family two-component response regulator
MVETDVEPPPCLLLVGPSEEARAAPATALIAGGLPPFEASDLQTAFAFAAATRPMLIVSTAVLPDGTGFELGYRLWHDVRTHAIPFIVLADTSAEDDAKASPADAMSLRPVTPDRLIAEARRLVDYSRLLRAAADRVRARAARAEARSSKLLEASHRFRRNQLTETD